MSHRIRPSSPSAFVHAVCASALIVALLPAIPAVETARADTTGARADTPEAYFVSVDELKRGDRCVGRTVFVGTEVEEFELEILGVVRGATPGTDLIIGRAEGALLESTGILQGMSGSPVYKDGRLVGAISSAWQFSKEPIAGITPIGEMLPALESMDAEGHAAGRFGRDGLPGLAMLPDDERAVSSLARICETAGMLDRHADTHSVPLAVAFGDRRLSPIAAPLVVSGADADYVHRASRVLGPGVTPLLGSGTAPGGATGDATGLAPGLAVVPGSSSGVVRKGGELEPGSAVGVQFVRGDANWTAIGTVTYLDGDRVVAFGHPLFNAGSIEMPMVAAYVHAVMPLQSTSFKYASGGRLLGTMREDRNKAVAGVVGPGPSMVPLTLNIRTGAGGRRFEFETVSSRPYTALFSGLAFGGAVSSAVKASGSATIELSVQIDTGDELVEYRDVFYTTEPAMRCGGELSLLLSFLAENAFEEREFRGVELDVTVREGELGTEILRVDADRTVYRPGDDVTLRVSMRPRRGDRFERELSLQIPESTPAGALTVRVGDATSFHLWERDRLGPGAAPRSYEQLLDLIRDARPGNVVVAQLLSDRQGLSLSGDEMRGVPGRAGLAMATSATSGAVDPSMLSVLREREFAVSGQVVGSHEITIHVEE